MGSFSLADLSYMFFNGLKNGTIGTIGAKGDPGGFNSGTNLAAGADLDLVTAAGIYGLLAGNTNPNWPFGSMGGILIVYERGTMGSGSSYQEFHPSSSSKRANVFARRTKVSDIWMSWATFSSTRTDQTAGRAIYQWDDLNNREQLIYGDTGWRDLTPLLANGWTAQWMRIRRVNNTATLQFLNVGGADATTDTIFTLPIGFQPSTGGYHLGLPFADSAPNNLSYIRIGGINFMLIKGRAAPYSTSVMSTVSWDVYEPWPTTLPGTAVGTVPNL